MRILAGLIGALVLGACVRIAPTPEARYCQDLRRAAAEADAIVAAAPRARIDTLAMLEHLHRRLERTEAELAGTGYAVSTEAHPGSEYVQQALIGLARAREPASEAEEGWAGSVASILRSMETDFLDRLDHCRAGANA